MVKKNSNSSDLQNSANSSNEAESRRISRNDGSNFCIEKIFCYELKNVSIVHIEGF